MAKLIAHRGLTTGPSKDHENRISTLIAARQSGFDVEFDVWYKDSKWWLGHDAPVQEIEFDWLCMFDQDSPLDDHHAWVHAKNIEALFMLRRMNFQGHYFFHDNDAAVLTSSGFLWTYPGQHLTSLSICLMPEWNGMLDSVTSLNVYAVCSDYVEQMRG